MPYICGFPGHGIQISSKKHLKSSTDIKKLCFRFDKWGENVNFATVNIKPRINKQLTIFINKLY